MRITCPACQASYEIPDHLLARTPERIRCARCGAEWAWARAQATPAEDFELPDLFSVGPISQAPREPPPALDSLIPGTPIPDDPTPVAEPEAPPRMPIGAPVFNPNAGSSLPPPQPFQRLVPQPPAQPKTPPNLFDGMGTYADPPLTAPPLSTPVLSARPPRRHEDAVEIPRMPAVEAPAAQPAPALPDVPTSRPMTREDAFRRVIENNRRRNEATLQPQSRRPQIIAILAVILLIALFFGVHFVMVNGVATGPSG
jgi:predicted Zn finger-like uncharacterized protein